MHVSGSIRVFGAKKYQVTIGALRNGSIYSILPQQSAKEKGIDSGSLQYLGHMPCVCE